MQFVDEDSPELDYDDPTAPTDNPFAFSTPTVLETAPEPLPGNSPVPRTPSEVAQYTAQWLDHDSEEEEEEEEESEETKLSVVAAGVQLEKFVVHESAEDQSAVVVKGGVESGHEHPGRKEEETEEDIHAEPPYLTRTSHSTAPHLSVAPPPIVEFPASSDPLQDLDQMVRAYQASMSGRSDLASGNFQSNRPPVESDESDFPVPTLAFVSSLPPAAEESKLPSHDFDSAGSSKSSDKDPFEREADLLEEEMEKVEEPTEELITRMSIRLQVPLEKKADGGKREIKARVSVRPSVGLQSPPSVVRPPGALLAEEMRNIRHFLTTALHPDIRLQCTIARNRSGFKRFFPVYTLSLESNSAFLLAAKKRPNNKTSNYLISMSESDLKKNSAFYLGKLRSNFLGTEYNMFDAGMNPKRKKANPGNVREQLGSVLYVPPTQLTKARIAPKEVTMLLPAVSPARMRTTWKPKGVLSTQKQDSMTAFYQAKDISRMKVLHSKRPLWVGGSRYSESNSFMLDFQNRVTHQSIKNVQLVDPAHTETVLLQTGKRGKNLFVLDFTYPFSPLQAFAFALSGFDFKLT